MLRTVVSVWKARTRGAKGTTPTGYSTVPATARASFGIYNTRDEIDALIGALHQARRVMG